MAAPADSGIEAEDDLIARDFSCNPTQADCWSDGYNGVPVGSFSFILDYIDSCSVTIKTQEYPNKGRVYKLDSNGTVGCESKFPWVLSISLSNWFNPDYCESGDLASGHGVLDVAYYANDTIDLGKNPHDLRCSGVGSGGLPDKMYRSRIRSVLSQWWVLSGFVERLAGEIQM
ncbi:hypothetical protein HO133_004656 [Letharia lupina]|uniref:Uncharacterized protein n=1 Tax=Letharia lupina TaxID=560253 RepID=A0A8H6FKQ0_9LECA|nr:uncharacterized protein HO133_004656 [Letharia lupina]KAF6230316.1 hypothetical protein HO133_004656 [Letharia lupina]